MLDCTKVDIYFLYSYLLNIYTIISIVVYTNFSLRSLHKIVTMTHQANAVFLVTICGVLRSLVFMLVSPG